MGADLFEVTRCGVSGVVLALLFPITCQAADNWLEKVFPDPENCLSEEGNIYFDFDQKTLVVRGYQHAEVQKHVTAADLIVQAECKDAVAIDSPTINKPGEFFGNQYSRFEIPASGLANGGCFSSSSYSIIFEKPAVAVRDEIKKRTGKKLEIYSLDQNRDGSEDEMPGYILDRGTHAEYVCSFSEYD